VLAHNSVDRDLMARDSIELTQPEPVTSSMARPRSPSTAQRGTSRSTKSVTPEINQDDSELLINREDLDLDELDGDEAQFLRTSRRVPVRRATIPKIAAGRLKIFSVIAAVVVSCAGISAWAYDYGIHSWRFRIQSSDSVEINGVRNAARAHVMEVAGADIGRNIFFVPLDERKKQLEQIPWVEQASVMRLLPNRIAVTIQERTPVAFAQIGSRTSLIDANGVVMGLPANRQAKYSFPVVRGITETEPLSSRAAAMKIYNRLVSELSDGTDGNAHYVQQLSEVDLADPEDVKVTANDPGGTMVVHLGAQDFLGHYKLYVAHIAEWRQQYQNVQSVDLRYAGQVIVNPDNRDRETGRSSDRVIEKPATTTAVVKPVSHKPKARKRAGHR
jgi:cell division protein FtsQ